MGIYSKQDLCAKAKQFLAAQKAGDERAFIVLLSLTAFTGLSATECQARIEAFAQGGSE